MYWGTINLPRERGDTSFFLLGYEAIDDRKIRKESLRRDAAVERTFLSGHGENTKMVCRRLYESVGQCLHRPFLRVLVDWYVVATI